MARFPAPVIAAVNGPAVGLGCSMALLSDLVLMAEGAFLADPHLSVGLVPGDGGPMLLPLIVGPARAKEMLFLGERVPATEAVRLGLANRVVPGEQLLDEAMDLARRLAALPVRALRDTKRAVNLHLEHAMATVMEDALAAERDSMRSAEHAEIVAKLVARRPLGGPQELQRPARLDKALEAGQDHGPAGLDRLEEGTAGSQVSVGQLQPGHLAHRGELELDDRRGAAVGVQVIGLQPFAGQPPRIWIRAAVGLELHAGQPARHQFRVGQHRPDLLGGGSQVDVKTEVRHDFFPFPWLGLAVGLP
jgi:hypothetical protein